MLQKDPAAGMKGTHEKDVLKNLGGLSNFRLGFCMRHIEKKL